MDPTDRHGVDGATHDAHDVESPASEHGTPTKRPALDERGMERPVFLLDFPEDPELEPLVRAFETGNYGRVRRDAERVARATESPAVREAALELRRRIEPDPLAKYLIAVSVGLLIALSAWAYHAQTH